MITVMRIDTPSPVGNSVNSLRGLPVFEGVPESNLVRLGLHASTRRLGAGEDLFVAGDPRTWVWFVRDGWIRLRVHSPGGHETTAELLGPGEAFGVSGFETYPFTASALTDVVVVGVSSAAFERWLKTDARGSFLLANGLSRRLIELTQLKAINAERAPVRLRLTLSWLVRKLGNRIPASRALLADLTGLRAETCSRVLSSLRRRGVLKVMPGQIHVMNPRGLLDSVAE